MKGLFAVLLLGVCSPVLAQQQGALETWTDAWIASPAGAHFRGNVLVMRNGRVLLRRSYGLADESWDVPNTPEGRFEIASITKQFTAVAILQLAEAGKISVHDKVSRYYTSAPPSWKDITIEELLTHTSGLPENELKDFTRGLTIPDTPEQLVETFRDRPLVFAPGTKWAYTNTEYYLLAYITGELSGESYGDYLRDHIFRPLAMTHSEFAATTAVIPDMTVGYTRKDGKLWHRMCFDRSLEIGAGGISTTVDDLVLWNRALDAPGFLTAQSLRAMFSVHPPGNYGYGWFIQDKPVRKIYHEGGDPGFAAYEARYPDQHALIIVLANEDDAPVVALSDAIADHLGLDRPE